MGPGLNPKPGLFGKAGEALASWALSRSLWLYVVKTGCCADEVLQSWGCRYDLERFGAILVEEPEQADVLVVFGAVSMKLVPSIQEAYSRMKEPKHVMAIGACACSGGLFANGGNILPGVDGILPVDVLVPGCPPRPEAFLNGLVTLQEKIRAGSRISERD